MELNATLILNLRQAILDDGAKALIVFKPLASQNDPDSLRQCRTLYEKQSNRRFVQCSELGRTLFTEW